MNSIGDNIEIIKYFFSPIFLSLKYKKERETLLFVGTKMKLSYKGNIMTPENIRNTFKDLMDINKIDKAIILIRNSKLQREKLKTSQDSITIKN